MQMEPGGTRRGQRKKPGSNPADVRFCAGVKGGLVISLPRRSGGQRMRVSLYFSIQSVHELMQPAWCRHAGVTARCETQQR